MIANVAILAAFAFFYSLVSARISTTMLTGPMFFVLFGLLAGPQGMAWIDWQVDAGGVRVLADWTLALVLFTDAADAKRSVLKRELGIPERMLLVGLPLGLVLGIGVGFLMFDQLGFYQIAIIATCLAATDAALGKETLHDKEVPTYLRIALNVESGLNDGLAVPILLVLIGLAHAQPVTDLGVVEIFLIILREIGVGVVVGALVVGVGVIVMQQAWRWHWIDPAWRQIQVVVLALCAFAVAQSLDGSGYIAAFCGGLVFRSLTRRLAHKLIFSATEVGETMSLLVWVFFGTVMLDVILPVFDWWILGYGFLSLTILRIVAIFLSLWGSGESVAAKLYLGWFGPRGLASIVFVVIVADAGIEGAHYIAGVVFCTVLMSVFLHGLTTRSLSHFLARDDKMVRHKNVGEGASDQDVRS